jgi:putative membrane protein
VTEDVAGTRSAPEPVASPVVGGVPAAAVPAAAARRLWARHTAFNWRLFLVRVLAAGIAIILTVLVVPGLGFSSWRLGVGGVLALTYALLVAVLKPLLEFLALRFLVATYGLVVILINAAVLFVLAQLLDDLIVYDRLWQLLLGGVVVGVLGLLLETVLGATPPVLDVRARS